MKTSVVRASWQTLLALVAALLLATAAQAQTTPFMQAVAEAAAKDKDLAAFYQRAGYAPIWTGPGNRDRQRRQAFLKAIAASENHGLPSETYRPDALRSALRAAKTPQERGRLEVEMSRLFLEYARDIQTGMLTPSRVDADIVRQIPYRDRLATLEAFSKSAPAAFIGKLPPRTPEYTRLMKEKLRLERELARGGWGPTVSAKSLKPGQSGAAVVALRDRLIAKGYLRRTATQSYDEDIQRAVQLFQRDHGLSTDGVAGPGTMREINTTMAARLRSIHVSMERERWMNRPRGKRHIDVNLTDFTAKIIDNGKVTFSTRSVVGANKTDRRSPEFSDVMEFMVVNPSWFVPRSIATKEYLPMLRQNPYAVKHLEITDARGRKIDRGAVDFTQYTEASFPYAMRQPPSRGNALGLVKFMFPNRYNIYLHDTPAKNLFGREVRAYSHGCIRLNDPFDFAYELLSKQTSDPEGFFQGTLATGRETRVDLKEPVPVHIMYRTAITKPEGGMEYRRDLYGRDAKIWNALSREGVALRAVQG